MPRRRGRRGRDRGLTLVELAVAVLVLSIGALAATRAGDQARVGIGAAGPRIAAQIAARNHAELLRIGDPGVGATPGVVTQLGHEIAITATRKPTAAGLTEVTIIARPVRSQGPGGGGAGMVAYLPGSGGG